MLLRPGIPFLPAIVSMLTLVHSLRGDILSLVAGGGNSDENAPAQQCRLHEPFAADFLPDRSLVIVEMETGNRVLKVSTEGTLTRLAGTGVRGFAGDGGPGREAQFDGMHSLTIASDGTIYIADTWNARIRRLSNIGGRVETMAGTGRKGFSGDGDPATAADFGSVIQIALTPDGKSLLVADIENKRVRRIQLSSGIVTTIAGNGKPGVPSNGSLAAEAPLTDPRGAIADAAGRVYILERSGHALRCIDTDGTIRTVAGTGKPGLSGDGGPALQATFNGPKHLCLDRNGSVLIADTENHVIRRYDPRTRTVMRVAGTGKPGTNGLGGDPIQAQLRRPHGVTLAPDGSLIITDSENDRVLRLVRN